MIDTHTVALIILQSVNKNKLKFENFKVKDLVVFQQLRKLQLEWKGGRISSFVFIIIFVCTHKFQISNINSIFLKVFLS